MNKLVSIIVIALFGCAGITIIGMIASAISPRQAQVIVVTATPDGDTVQKVKPTQRVTQNPTATPFRLRTASPTPNTDLDNDILYIDEMLDISLDVILLLDEGYQEAEYGTAYSLMAHAESVLPDWRALQRRYERLSPPAYLRDAHQYIGKSLDACEASYEYLTLADFDNAVTMMEECSLYMDLATSALPEN